jgi:Rrf2 family nitric oxide-sensitive transcriptional repressor
MRLTRYTDYSLRLLIHLAAHDGKLCSIINVGEVVRHTEEGFDLADCANCAIASACGLTGALAQALRAFMAVLDGYTLADLAGRRSKIRQLLAIEGVN